MVAATGSAVSWLSFGRIVDVPFEVCVAALETWPPAGKDGELRIGQSLLRRPIENDRDWNICQIEVGLARGPLRPPHRMRLEINRWHPPSSRTALERQHLAALPDPDGVSTFRMRELRPGWAPPQPRGQRCSHGRRRSPRPPLAVPPRPGPAPRSVIPSPGALGNEASAGVHSRSPVRSSPRLRARMERNALRLLP
jgi:hypothetical protein